jgi:hypothetical protein
VFFKSQIIFLLKSLAFASFSWFYLFIVTIFQFNISRLQILKRINLLFILFLEIYFLFIIIVQLLSKYCRFKIELTMLSITFISFNIWHENRLFEIILIDISCKRKVSKNHLFFGQVIILSELKILMNLKLKNQSMNRLGLNYCFKNSLILLYIIRIVIKKWFITVYM